MVLYGLFFWSIVFLLFTAYLYLKFLRNELDRTSLAFASVISGVAVATVAIASFTW